MSNMIDISVITKALESQLLNDANVVAEGMHVTRGEYVNNIPEHTPWIGIYRTGVKDTPNQLGTHADSWQGAITIKVIIQASSLASGAACEDKLERYIKIVKDAIWAIKSLQGSVIDMIVGFSIDYSYTETESETLYFQWAMLTIDMEVSTG